MEILQFIAIVRILRRVSESTLLALQQSSSAVLPYLSSCWGILSTVEPNDPAPRQITYGTTKHTFVVLVHPSIPDLRNTHCIHRASRVARRFPRTGTRTSSARPVTLSRTVTWHIHIQLIIRILPGSHFRAILRRCPTPQHQVTYKYEQVHTSAVRVPTVLWCVRTSQFARTERRMQSAHANKAPHFFRILLQHPKARGLF